MPFVPSSFLLLVVMPGATFVASLLLAMHLLRMKKQILDDSSVAAFAQLGASFFAAARARLAGPREVPVPGGGRVGTHPGILTIGHP